MADNLKYLLRWLCFTFDVEISENDIYNPDQKIRQQHFSFLRNIASEILDYTFPVNDNFDTYEALLRGVCEVKQFNSSYLELSESSTEKEKFGLLLRFLLGCAVTSFQKETLKKQGYVAKILELQDNEQNEIKNALKQEIEEFNRFLETSRFGAYAEPFTKPNEKVNVSEDLCSKIQYLERELFDMEVKYETVRTEMRATSRQKQEIQEMHELLLEKEDERNKLIESKKRLEARAQEQHAEIRWMQEEIAELKRELSSKDKLINNVKGLRDQLEHSIKEKNRFHTENGKMASLILEVKKELAASRACSKGFQNKCISLELRERELRQQVIQLQSTINMNKHNVDSNTKSIDEEVSKPRVFKESYTQCELLTPQELISKASKAAELSELNESLRMEVDSLARKNKSIKEITEKEVQSVKELQARNQKEINEWEEYAQKLESEIETFSQTQKDLDLKSNEIKELKLEVEFWTKKTEELHEDISMQGLKLREQERISLDREGALSEEILAIHLKYRGSLKELLRKYKLLSNYMKSQKKKEIESKKQMKRLLLEQAEELDSAQKQLRLSKKAAQECLVKAAGEMTALNARFKLELEDYAEQKCQEKLAMYLRDEGSEINALAEEFTENSELMRVLTNTLNDSRLKEHQEKTELRSQVEKLQREIEWLREQQRHQHLMSTSDLEVFQELRVKQPERTLAKMIGKLEAEKKAINAAKLSEIEKRVVVENRLKSIQLEMDKLKFAQKGLTPLNSLRASTKGDVVSSWFPLQSMSKPTTQRGSRISYESTEISQVDEEKNPSRSGHEALSSGSP